MTCAEAVRQYLLTLTPVTTLVNQRIWTFRFPQSPTPPAVLVQQISDVEEAHLRGTTGLRLARIQVDVVAATIGAARAVDAAIVGDYAGGAATGLRGAVFQVGSPAVAIKQVIADNYRELFEPDEVKLARVTRDYRVWYEG